MSKISKHTQSFLTASVSNTTSKLDMVRSLFARINEIGARKSKDTIRKALIAELCYPQIPVNVQGEEREAAKAANAVLRDKGYVSEAYLGQLLNGKNMADHIREKAEAEGIKFWKPKQEDPGNTDPQFRTVGDMPKNTQAAIDAIMASLLGLGVTPESLKAAKADLKFPKRKTTHKK